MAEIEGDEENPVAAEDDAPVGEEGTPEAEPAVEDVAEPEETVAPPPPAPVEEKGPEGGTVSEKPKIKRVMVRSTPPVIEDPNAVYLPCLPPRPNRKAKYKPILYTFRVPNATDGTSIRNGAARRVPFYVQLDHCIAVIWSLISPEETDKVLGIAQLQWALVFLKAIHNRTGDNPKDIQFLIDTIEDRLLEQYAELGDELDIIEDYDCTCTPQECVDTSLSTKEYPFSLNYAEMIKYCPEPSAAYRVPSMTEEELAQELENIKQAAGVTSLDKLDTVSREKAIDFLSAWKKNQVEKIQAEIERLKSMENLLNSIDNQRFTGRIDEKQFETLFQ